MNKFLLKITPEGALRVGLGLMYVYSGIDMLLHPTSWLWVIRSSFKFLPDDMRMSLFANQEFINNYVLLQGIAEFILAIIFLSWFIPRYIVKFFVLLSIFKFIAILALVSINAVTFEIVGLLGVSVALWMMLKNNPIPNHISIGLGQVNKPIAETFEEFMGEQSK